MLTRKTVLLAKTETEYGADSSPTATANALLVRNVAIRPIGEVLERDYLRPDLSPLEFGRGSRYVQITFETEIKGTGTAGALPAWGWEGELLKACGMEEEISPGSHILYHPSSVTFPSITIYGYVDSLFRKIVGCRGTWTLKWEVGKYGFFRWDFRGVYVSPIDGSPQPPAFSTIKPPVCLAANLVVGGYSPVADRLEFSLNNKIAQRKSINSSTGVAELIITGRNTGGSFTPEATLEADHGFWAKWETAASFPLSIGPIGSAAGNRVSITAPKVQYRDIKDSSRDGVFTYEAPFGLAGEAGDDEILITFE